MRRSYTSFSFATLALALGILSFSLSSQTLAASRRPVAINGACGAANGLAVSAAPTSNLCSEGTPTTVSGTGPWTWTCDGSNGGKNASCSAKVAVVNGQCSTTAGVCTAGSPINITNSTGMVTWSCQGSSGGTTANCTSNTSGGEQAYESDVFVDSIGVNASLNYIGSVFDSPKAEQVLISSGIRHFRSAPMPGNGYGGWEPGWTLFNDLAAHGVHGDYLFDIHYFAPPESGWNPTIAAFVAGVTGIDSFEGSNEYTPSCTSVTSWPTALIAQQQALYAAVQAVNPAIPVLAPSLGACSGLAALQTDATSMGNMLAEATGGNIHPYAFPGAPEQGALVNSQGGPPSWLSIGQIIAPSPAPIYATEYGYGSPVSAGGAAVSGATAVAYLTRSTLNLWNQGFARSYIFDLLDDPNDLGTCASGGFGCFGLYDGSYNIKPPGAAIKNLIATLADPGAAFAPGSLSYTLTGTIANVMHTLLQKHDGSFYYIVWEALPVGSASEAVTLNLSATSKVTATTFSSTGALENVTLSQKKNAYSFTVTTTPIIIHIVPG